MPLFCAFSLTSQCITDPANLRCSFLDFCQALSRDGVFPRKKVVFVDGLGPLWMSALHMWKLPSPCVKFRALAKTAALALLKPKSDALPGLQARTLSESALTERSVWGRVFWLLAKISIVTVRPFNLATESSGALQYNQNAIAWKIPSWRFTSDYETSERVAAVLQKKSHLTGEFELRTSEKKEDKSP